MCNDYVFMRGFHFLNFFPIPTYFAQKMFRIKRDEREEEEKLSKRDSEME